MLFPVTVTESILERVERHVMVLEVWDRGSSDLLLGIVRLNLGAFASVLRSEFLTESVYPFIGVDEHRVISSLGAGKDVGFLRVCMAIGTAI